MTTSDAASGSTSPGRGSGPAGRNQRLTLALLTLSLAWEIVPYSAAAPPTADEVLTVLGFSAGDRGRLREGEIVSRGIEELSDKEIAISMAVIVPAPLAEILDFARTDKGLRSNRDVIAFGSIATGPGEADLSSIGFDRSEFAEILALLQAEPGSRFNLSEGELERFAGLRKRYSGAGCEKDPACGAAVTEQYRAVLSGRLRAYRERGLAGIEPYVRQGGGRADPGAELRAAALSLKLAAERLPVEHDALLNYPKGDQSSVEHEFLWIKQRVQDRPTFVLAHRVRALKQGMALAVERQFYVGQSYNSLQVTFAMIPAGEQTVVVYLNRTSTDQVSGFMKETRHTMGRRIMEKEIRRHFAEMQASLAARRGAAPGR